MWVDCCTFLRTLVDIPMGNQEARATRISREPTSGGSYPPKRERYGALCTRVEPEGIHVGE